MVAAMMSFSSTTTLLLVVSYFITLIFSRVIHVAGFRGVDSGNPVVHVNPSPLTGNSFIHGSKEVVLCERVQVSSISRLNLGSYASSIRVTLSPSVAIPERLHNKIQVCFHRNESLGLCRCEMEEWASIQKGLWSTFVSPYEDKYLDIKCTTDLPGPITIAIQEDIQQWRLVCLALGFTLLLVAPIISNWVPFYYSSSMTIGVFLVIIILLFQGMKLLPTGRKNILYLTLYGSLFGAGSFLLNQLSLVVNSILVNFGWSQEMHNPVFVFLLLGIGLAGAALGYWIVRKYVISKDGNVDVGVAQFVKWAMRIIGTTFILQSTLDTSLAMGVLISCWIICHLIISSKWHQQKHEAFTGKGSLLLQHERQTIGRQSRAEFLSRSTPKGKVSKTSRHPSAWSDSPIKGVLSSSSQSQNKQEYYSTFHKMPNRKRYSKKEWDDFTRESTRQALAECAASSEFADWIIEHAHRIQLLPSDSSDETMGSGSDSTDETAMASRDQFSFINW